MSLTLTLTGTGGAIGRSGMGLQCAPASEHGARRNRRQPCSGAVKFNEAISPDRGRAARSHRSLVARIVPAVLLTHYHMDHVRLFRCAGAWATQSRSTVHRDEQGCDDLFKHPGLLDFSHTVEPFVGV